MDWLRKIFTGPSFWYIIAGASLLGMVSSLFQESPDQIYQYTREIIFFISLATAEILTALKPKSDTIPE